MKYQAARGGNVLLGSWLSSSAFLWGHSLPQFNNALIVGCSVSAFALLALAAPILRYVNTVLGGWLLVSAFALPSAHWATICNSTAVAILIVTLTLRRAPGEI